MIKNRNQQMDVLRGIGIILVVLGHTAFPANHFIYLFHLAIFFMLSGYFFKSEEITNTRNLKQYILKKIKIKHVISTICILILLFVAATSCYEIYTVNQAKKKFDEMWPIHYEERITEDKEITE